MLFFLSNTISCICRHYVQNSISIIIVVNRLAG